MLLNSKIKSSNVRAFFKDIIMFEKEYKVLVTNMSNCDRDNHNVYAILNVLIKSYNFRHIKIMIIQETAQFVSLKLYQRYTSEVPTH